MNRWRLHLLGVEQLTEVAGRSVAPPDIFWPLIGSLLAAPGGSASRAWIANELWPEAPDDAAAKHRLGTALWRIGSRFAPLRHLLRVDQDRILLCPDARFWIDALAFERRARRALARPEELDCARARRRLARALALYRGDLLASRHNDGLLLERERLRALFIDASFVLASGEARLGNWQQARVIAERLCQVEPLREDAQRLLIEAHAACGNRAVAIRQYRALERLLEAELAVAPMPETVRLHQRIAAAHGAASVSDAATAMRRSPVPAPLLPAPAFRASLVAARDQISALIAQLDTVA